VLPGRQETAKAAISPQVRSFMASSRTADRGQRKRLIRHHDATSARSAASRSFFIFPSLMSAGWVSVALHPRVVCGRGNRWSG